MKWDINRNIIWNFSSIERIISMSETTATTSRLEEEINDIPLADEDVTEELSDGPDSSQNQSEKLSESDSQRYRLDGQSMESITSVYTNGTDSPSAQHSCKSFLN